MPDAGGLRAEGEGSLAAWLIGHGKLAPSSLERAERLVRDGAERLDTVLVRLGLVAERDLAEGYAALLGLSIVAASDFPAEPVLAERINRKFLRHNRCLPLADADDGLVLAMADPLDADALEAMALTVKKPVLRRVALPSDLEAAWERLYGASSSSSAASGEADLHADAAEDDVERLKDLASEAPVVRLVNQLIARAVEARASDIHLDPTETGLRVRYRLDGVLREVDPPPARLRAAVVSRIKIMARLDIAERRLAQDGRIRLAVRGRDVDFRVATTPSAHGESVVLRILDRSAIKLDFAALGFDAETLDAYLGVLRRPHGILLVTGPTSSGKTTTLYASLQLLNRPERKLLTIEDPIEYQLDGVTQVPVQPEIGRTFANVLRSFLRHNPDIVMVGEIRDIETARVAMEAALTGQLVLSTLHTNDAASGVTRLLDMGVEDYHLASVVNGFVAQRLVRTLCMHCREPYRPLPDMIERLGLRSAGAGEPELWRPVGCESCGGTGYTGRTALLEVLPMTDAIRALVLQRPEMREIRRAAIRDGMRTMFGSGIRKALAGETSLDEVLRVTEPD